MTAVAFPRPPLPWRLGAALAAVLLLLAAQALPDSLALIRQYAHSSGPYHDVAISDADADLYWAGAGRAMLPGGVSRIRLDAQPPDFIIGSARVDFDQLAHDGKTDPLLSMFSGTHTILVRARVVSFAAPVVHLAVTEVRIDGQVVPETLVDAAIAAFVAPRDAGVGRSFEVPLPPHAVAVEVQSGDVVIHYPHR